MEGGREGLLLQRVCAALTDKVRLSAARRAILACVCAAPRRDWTADELFAECNAECSGATSRASVYRLLELLCAAGLMAVQPPETGRGGKAAPRAVGTSALPGNGGCQHYALTPVALAEISVTDPASGRNEQFAATPELQRVLSRLCRAQRWVLQEFAIEVRGEYRPRRSAAGAGTADD